MSHENDAYARYLASRVITYREQESQGVPPEQNTGMSYERAITSTRTTKEAIDWWIDKMLQNPAQ